MTSETLTEKLQAFVRDPALQPWPVWESAFLSPEELVFSEQVRAACEANLCGCYGKRWTCPPGAGDLRSLRARCLSYPRAFVFTTKHPLEDSFDFEGMTAARLLHRKLEDALLLLPDVANADRELLGVGSCDLCAECSYPSAPCRHPDRARRSLEACGIDVVALAERCGLRYGNGENTVTYFSVLFYREP